MKIKKIKDVQWQENIQLIFDCSGEELDKYVDKKYGIKIKRALDSNGCYINFNDDCGVRLIWVESFNFMIHEQAMLTHELLHLVFDVLEERGFKLSKDSEEAYTYYFQHLYTEIWGKLSEELNPKKKK